MMSALPIGALALAFVIVAILIRAAARGRRALQLPPDVEKPSTALTDDRTAAKAPSAPPRGDSVAKRAAAATVPSDDEIARTEKRLESAARVESAPPPSHRPTIPPRVVKALSEPPMAGEAEPEPEEEPEPEPEPVPVLAPTPVPPSAPTPVPGSAPTPLPEAAPAPARAHVAAPVDRAALEAADPERKKARKLARLIVSEIKLYNEKLVAEGRAAGDLYARLQEPIDQSLVLFQRRIPEAVRTEFDYMHDEFVRQLAGGDASKLGSNYKRPQRG